MIRGAFQGSRKYTCNMNESELAAEELKHRWQRVLCDLESRFGKKPDLNAILMLIGMRELGQVRDKWTKEEKVHLMHIAVCKLFSQSGYYQLQGTDEDGWPHWEAVKKLPFVDVFEQEMLLKQHIVDYFETL